MKISPVSRKNAAQYIRYCRLYGAEHDDSFLPDEAFIPTDEYPAYLASEGEHALGAVGLMRTLQYRRKGTARLTVYHAADKSPETYASLLNAIRPHAAGLDYVHGFLPEARTEARRCWEALGFTADRHIYSLAYRAHEFPDARIPEGYTLTTLARDDAAGIRELCGLWNRNYGSQPGFIGASPEWIADGFDGPEHVPGGTLLLKHGPAPVGTVRVSRDDAERKTADVAMLSIHPDYRGRGLGRLLLRKAVEAALRNDLHPVYLSVNAENASAVALYLSEGFTGNALMVCYKLDVK
ncbi:MAG: GNAT family N-acetyltransferase [Anaerolineales bacterium]|nr:GNAT family N-acetyltransferase [Anaerolineales bacterium]